MLQDAIDLQQRAVRQLLNQATQKNEITFKAPTGSGKTHMMANMMNEIISKDSSVIFLVSALSKGDLAQQNYLALKRYQNRGQFPFINPYLISTDFGAEERPSIPDDYNVYILPRDLYKSGGILMRGVLEGLLHRLSDVLNGLGKTIYLIKDECHIQTNNLDNISSEFFSKTFNFSATPKLSRGQIPDVEITEEEAQNARLIKNIVWGDETDTLDDAVNKFESIKKDYRNKLGVNPCLIIQISNKNGGKAQEELDKIVFPVLNKIEHQELKWMVIVDKDAECDTNDILKKVPVSKWKSYAKEPLSTIDVIVFKISISEGWDIPRACMLFQIRSTESKQLDEQVLGRVRRNPRLLDFEQLSETAQRLALTSWVWGMKPKESKNTFHQVYLRTPIEVENEIQIQTTRLKPLNQKEGFELSDYMLPSKRVVGNSIFDLYKKYQSSQNDIKELCRDNVQSVSDWFAFMENIDLISKKRNAYINNYEESMVVTLDDEGNETKASFPRLSGFSSNGAQTTFIPITNWVWKRKDTKYVYEESQFGFDSEAEKKWVDLLLGLSQSLSAIKTLENKQRVSLWGKNFIENSEIKFEYYLNGNHFSFPDFVMKDSKGRIHIIEVKSINTSNSFSINEAEYTEKVLELKKCYKQASKLTHQFFYLPVLDADDWKIFMYDNGIETIISENQFIDFVLS